MHTKNDVYPLAPGVAPTAITPSPSTESPRAPLWLPPENKFKRAIFLLVALAIVGGYAFFLQSYWAPAIGRPGIDENAYLLGGRNLFQHGTTGFKPSDDFQFVDAMWIRTKAETISPPAWLPSFLARRLTARHTQEGWYFPKYPAGECLLNAIAIRFGGIEMAFAVSPISMVVAALGMFFLARAVAGSFAGVLAIILLVLGSSTALELSMAPNSHAPALCMVVWGMYFLIRWWQTGRWWIGAFAGFLLGYAVTIRYTEALLLFPLYPIDQFFLDIKFNSTMHPHLWQIIQACRLLPVGPLGIVVLMQVQWKRFRSYLSAAVPILFWAIPVTALVTFNWFSMGHLTGYDATHESIGFTFAEFLRKWDFTLHELYLFGLFLIFPLGVAGLILMYRSTWRMALLLTLWFVPGALLYTAYYWGLNDQGMAFLRFFLTLFPPVIVAGLWLLCTATRGATVEGKRRNGSIAGPLAAGILTFAAVAVGLMAGVPIIERQHRGNMNLHTSAQHIIHQIAVSKDKSSRPMVFDDEGIFPQLLQYMQFMVDGDWYTYDAFKVRAAGGMGLFGALQLGKDDSTAPVLIQHERLAYMADVMKGKSEKDLVNEQHRLIDQALADHRPVYAILTGAQETDFNHRFISGKYEMKKLDQWAEPCTIRVPGDEVPPGQLPVLQAQGPLVAQEWFAEVFVRWHPQKLTMFEIHKVPAK